MYSIDSARRALEAVDLVEGLPLDEIHSRLEIGLRLGDTGQAILAFYLAEMADLARHQATGHRRTLDYAMGRLGMDRRRAGELIAAGRKLRELPLVLQAFCEQRIGWSKVMALLQVVVPEHQEAWIERAEQRNCNALRLEVKLSRAGSKPRKPGDLRGTREARFPVRATLDPLGYDTYRNAKRKLTDERGEPITDADFLTIAARLILGSDDDGTIPGRKRVPHSLYQVVLHDVGAGGVAEGAAGGEASLLVDSDLGRVPIDGGEDDPLLSRARSAAVLCDAGMECADHPTLDEKTPDAMRKRVLRRDGHRCRVCGRRHDLEVHHIVFRSRGGPTEPGNLITTCNGCHSLVHAGLLVLEGPSQKDVRFGNAEGEPIARAGEYASRAALLELARPRPTEAAPRPAPVEPTTLADVPEAVDTAWWQRHAPLIRCRDAKRLELVEGVARDAGPAEAGGSDAPAPLPAAEAFAGLVGQDALTAVLAAAAEGSRLRGQAYPHTLFVGPAGTGKTTLARGVARVAGARLVTANGPLVQDATGLLTLLTQLGEGDMLFLDEIHAVPAPVLEVLYEALTDGAISLTLHAGLEAKPVRLELPRFTVLAATTVEAELDEALLSRFGRPMQLGLYDVEDLAQLVAREAAREGHALEPEAARLVATHARGTPRGALCLLTRVLNDVLGRGAQRLDAGAVRKALRRLGYDERGLDRDEQRYLALLARRARPLALGHMARALRLSEKTVLERIEPELLDRDLVAITPRGRVALPNKSAGYPADLYTRGAFRGGRYAHGMTHPRWRDLRRRRGHGT